MIRSLRFKFILFIVAILFVLILLMNTYPITSARDTMIQEKRSSLTSQASAVASALSTLPRLTHDSVSDVLGGLDLENFDRTVVINSFGTVIFDDGSGGSALQDLEAALNGELVFHSAAEDRAICSRVAVPIGQRDSVRGAVALYEDDYELGHLIHTVRQRIAVLSLFIGIIALLLAELFAWLVTRRVRALTHSMNIVAAGNYNHRHTVTGNDEISALGQEFNDLTVRLEETEALRRHFVSDASHELKTPIASIRLLSDSILQTEQMDSDTVREFVADIRTEAVRLQRTTEKLLTLSLLDDDLQPFFEPVDLKQVTLETLSALTPLARDRNIRLSSNLEDGCIVMGSADGMLHIVFNLVENGIKYNVPEGSVSVQLSQDEKTVLLSVADTGIGIPEEDRLNIFTRFYRVDKARSRLSGGSGLGLSIVHDAVAAYNGSIRVENNSPRGSVFLVSFPRPLSEEKGT